MKLYASLPSANQRAETFSTGGAKDVYRLLGRTLWKEN